MLGLSVIWKKGDSSFLSSDLLNSDWIGKGDFRVSALWQEILCKSIRENVFYDLSFLRH